MQDDTHPGTVLFLSHGGGPLPLLGDPSHQELVDFLQNVTVHFKKPEAIVVISAHWEENRPSLTAHPSPSLLYDYYGFPEESYQIAYPAKGAPQLAEKILAMLEGAGIAGRLDPYRGFDHGLFTVENHVSCCRYSLCAVVSGKQSGCIGSYTDG